MVDLQAERRKAAERRAARGEPVPKYLREEPEPPQEEPLEPGPTLAALEDHRIAAAEPYIRDVRLRVFGATEPPFGSRADPACQRWEGERAERRTTRADRTLDEAVDRLATVTGFKPFDVYTWILTGARPPHLPRAFLSVHAVRDVMPDGTNIRRKWVTITINAPVTKAEMRRLWGRLNAAWTDPASGPDFRRLAERRSKTPKLTNLDSAALQLVERMPDATWDQRAAAWKLEQGKGIKANTLHQRYRRAAEKRARLEGSSPSQREE